MACTHQDIVAAVTSPKFSHTRYRRFACADLVYVYHRDPTSPSGVKLAVMSDQDVVESILSQHRKAMPLSPTEGLRGAGLTSA